MKSVGKVLCSLDEIDYDLVLRAKRMGFLDAQVADLVDSTEDAVHASLRGISIGVQAFSCRIRFSTEETVTAAFDTSGLLNVRII